MLPHHCFKLTADCKEALGFFAGRPRQYINIEFFEMLHVSTKGAVGKQALVLGSNCYLIEI